MQSRTWKKLDDEFDGSPIMKASPGTQTEVDIAAQSIGCQFHDDYREFLLKYGGAMVGAYPIFGVRKAGVMGNDAWSVIEMTKRFRSQGWEGTAGWYVVSIDGGGNPIGIAPDGCVWISDHDFGEITVMASDFETFLTQRCLTK